MGLAGIWHGAGLQFLIFGLLHAAYLSINHAWRIFVVGRNRKATQHPLKVAGYVLLTFAP
jgi:D-alanyl-lipoteichoic acid acyltransferase DltB (MBOAT superfamily)